MSAAAACALDASVVGRFDTLGVVPDWGSRFVDVNGTGSGQRGKLVTPDALVDHPRVYGVRATSAHARVARMHVLGEQAARAQAVKMDRLFLLRMVDPRSIVAPSSVAVERTDRWDMFMGSHLGVASGRCP